MVRLARPEFAPDPSLSNEEMTALQREIATAARFEDDADVGPDALRGRVVAGVDQAFFDDRAVSAIVAMRDGEVIERTAVVSPLSIPYVPGLLAFREGGPIVDAFETLEVEPDLALFDGSGRIHYRQAGLATHMGVLFDRPSVGVAKSLLCGRPAASLEGLPAGSRVRILADDRVEAPRNTVIGHAVQTRQYAARSRHINPVYVSSGHRVGGGTAAALAIATCEGYKLPEPIRLADRYASTVAAADGEGAEPSSASGNGSE